MPTAPEPPTTVHRPVMLDEVLHWLDLRPGMTILDGTAGAGGHTAAIAARVQPGGRVVGVDPDPEMLALARAAVEGLPVTLVQGRYSAAADILDDLGLGQVDGILLDLGLSSDQLAWTHRGFSFDRDGPLDMRYDPAQNRSAADIVNGMPEAELADLIYLHGEERHSRRIARNIVEARKAARFETTAQLAAVVRRGVPGKWGPMDPATRTFQALRIEVNRELEHLDAILPELADLLAPGGRATILSFHSLEDRRVKHAFRDDPDLTVLTKKPATAGEDELSRNPRARSAKLRVAQRCTSTTSTGTTPSPTKVKSRR